MKLRLAILSAIVAVAVAACSGGGGISPSPSPTPTVPGVGYTGAFSASVTFQIIVPSAAAAAAIRRRNTIARTAALRDLPVRAVASASPSAPPSGPPYVSPLVGFIEITPVGVNGSSLAVTQPPVVVTGGCPVSGSGCTLKASVPAAPGAVNRYFVQTFGPGTNGAFGTLISSGYIDVTVPATGSATASLGGSIISLGGYVASIKFSPASADLPEGVPTNLNVIVEALDATGAVIIGDTYFAIPIGVTSSETQNFTIDGQTGALTVAGTSQKQIALAYSGGTTLGTVLDATSTDSNGNAVSARLPVAVSTATPSPTPSPSPTPTASPTRPGSTPTPVRTPTPTPTPTPIPTYPAMSIYTIDQNNDNIVEYDVVNKILADQPFPTPTPRRVVQFNSAALPTVACATSFGGLDVQLDEIAGLIVDGAGRILTQSSCTDGSNTYVYQFPGTATGAPTPTVFGSELGVGYVTDPLSAASGGGVYYFSIQGGSDVFEPFGFTPTGNLSSEYFTNQCAAELGQSPSCNEFDTPGSYGDESGALAADGTGNLFVAQNYEDNVVTNGNPVTPPGPGSAPQLVFPPVISVYAKATGALPAVQPEVDIAGAASLLGGSTVLDQPGFFGTPGDAPAAMAIDGSTLYVLAPGSSSDILLYVNGNEIAPGLAACPAPSSNAPVNSSAAGNATNCADGSYHNYIVAFDISDLLSVANFGLDVELAPKFVLGGDTIGRFGVLSNFEGSPAQSIAAYKGIVAVANTTPGDGNTLGEIDVYDTRSLGGGQAYTNVKPTLVIPNLPASGSFTGTSFATVAIGPTGSGTGGLSLLSKRNQHVGRLIHRDRNARRFRR